MFLLLCLFFNAQFSAPSGLFHNFLLSQHLELPRCLVLVIQTVGVEIELPRRGRLVLIVQAVPAETQPRGTVRGRGEGGRVAQMVGHAVVAHGAHGGARGRQLVVHGRKVGAAVHAGEVGRGARVALVVGRRLAVGHWIRALHAGGGGGRQRVGERGYGRGAPDGNGRRAAAAAAAHGRERGAGRRGELPAGSALRAYFPHRGGFLFQGLAHSLVLHSGLRLLGLLAMLGPSVFEPNLGGEKNNY